MLTACISMRPHAMLCSALLCLRGGCGPAVAKDNDGRRRVAGGWQHLQRDADSQSDSQSVSCSSGIIRLGVRDWEVAGSTLARGTRIAVATEALAPRCMLHSVAPLPPHGRARSVAPPALGLSAYET